MARTANPNKPKRSPLDGYKTYDTSNGYGSPSEWVMNFKDRMGLSAAREAVGADLPRSILGVTFAATWDEIKSAYRKLAMQFHPDRNPGINPALFRKIQGAFEILEAEFGKA